MEHLFSRELCGEEQRIQEEATEMMRLRDEEIATRGSPTMSRHSEKGEPVWPYMMYVVLVTLCILVFNS